MIIDCDPGTDDAFALLLAFASAELDVLGVTVSGGNVAMRDALRNALGLRRLAGAQVPVFAGAERGLIGAFQGGPDGLRGCGLPDGGTPADGVAADAIRRMLREAAQPVTVVGIGPATNLGLALATEPSVAAKVERFVLMSGAWGEGNVTPCAEFNAAADPEALQIVLSAGRPVVMATLEVTAQAVATAARIAALRGAGHGACLRMLCDAQARVPPSRRLGGEGGALHDACAVAWLIAPALFTTRACAATVALGPGPSRGRTVIDRWQRSGNPANVTVLERLDTERFFSLLGERLSCLP